MHKLTHGYRVVGATKKVVNVVEKVIVESVYLLVRGKSKSCLDRVVILVDIVVKEHVYVLGIE